VACRHEERAATAEIDRRPSSMRSKPSRTSHLGAGRAATVHVLPWIVRAKQVLPGLERLHRPIRVVRAKEPRAGIGLRMRIRTCLLKPGSFTGSIISHLTTYGRRRPTNGNRSARFPAGRDPTSTCRDWLCAEGIEALRAARDKRNESMLAVGMSKPTFGPARYGLYR